MQLSEYKNIYENEGSHFYYVGYHKIILSLVKKYLKRNQNNKILDIGCGPGLLTKSLEKFGHTQGIDTSPEALKYARKRGLKVKKGSILELPFKQNTFDLVILIDVLCNKSIKSDTEALKEVSRVLKPGGILILKLPAFNILYGSHDVIVHTKKRYQKDDLELAFKKAKMESLNTTYIGSFLFPVVLLKTVYEKLTNTKDYHSSVEPVWPPLNNFLTNLFNLEDRLIKKIGLPFGISVVAVARK